MKAILLNDCSQYHVGSRVVAEQLTRLAKEAGMELQPYAEGEGIEPGTLVLLNGEGTMHHDAPRALELHTTAAKLKQQGARVILLNATVQALHVDFSIFERIAARDSRSAAFIAQAGYGGPVAVIPDLAFCHEPCTLAASREGPLFLDSVSARATRMVKEVSQRFVVHPPLNLCEWQGGAETLLEMMRGSEWVVAGRFHGVILAMLSGTPFLAAPSNSWKTVAMLEDFGLAHGYCRNAAELREKIAQDAFVRVGRSAAQRIAAVPTQWREFFASLASATAVAAPQAAAPQDAAPVEMKHFERTDGMMRPEAACVLVGNGPSVGASGLGRVIDAFDEVVRFNNYRLEGFGAHAGTRTTLWSTFGQGMLPKDSPPPERMLFIHGSSGKPAASGEVWRIPHAFYAELQSRIRGLSCMPDTFKGNPSSGCLVAHWLISQGVRRLHLAGFDHFSRRRRKQHHYWQTKPAGKPRDHDGEVEALLFAQLAEQGRVHYLT